jgi:hypothetical protein
MNEHDPFDTFVGDKMSILVDRIFFQHFQCLFDPFDTCVLFSQLVVADQTGLVTEELETLNQVETVNQIELHIQPNTWVSCVYEHNWSALQRVT